jgi:hypothetical protein
LLRFETAQLFLGHLVATVGRRLGGDGAVVAHLGLVDDELALALAQVLDLDAVVGHDLVAVDEELDWGRRILDLKPILLFLINLFAKKLAKHVRFQKQNTASFQLKRDFLFAEIVSIA